MLAEAAASGARGAIKFGGLVVGVLISILTPSPILKETRFAPSAGRPAYRLAVACTLTPQQ